jgi:hypothetical protein
MMVVHQQRLIQNVPNVVPDPINDFTVRPAVYTTIVDPLKPVT